MILYNIALTIAAIVALPYVLIRMLITYKFRTGMCQRFGIYPRHIQKPGEQPLIWIHAASVGEVLAAKPLMAQLRAAYPKHQILFSTLTAAGNSLCRNKLDADYVIYFPLDFPWVVKRALNRFSPELIIVVETELWPNFLSQAHARGTRLVLVNGRISKRSFPRYQKIARFMQKILNTFDAVIMQDQIGYDRVIALGTAPDVVHIAGSLKHDAAAELTPDPTVSESIRSQLGLDSQAKVIVGGCTHPGEEELLLDCWQEQVRQNPGVRLILAPRHIERVGEIETLMKQRGIAHVRYTDAAGYNSDAVILIDVIGVLADLYRVADVAVVGKSFTQHGGHNPIEPAALCRPIVFGPNMENFLEIAQKLISNRGAVQLKSSDELSVALNKILDDSQYAQTLGANARNTIEAESGAAERTLAIIASVVSAKTND